MSKDPTQKSGRTFRVSPAMVVALVALTAAVSGVAVAAPAGKKQHKAKAVAASNRGQRGPRGFRGFRGFRGYAGPAGATGARGPAGVVPAIVTVDSPMETLGPGQTTYDVDPANFVARCPAGYTVLGTGFYASVAQTAFVLSYGTFVGGFINNNSSISIQGVHLQAVCGVVPGGSSGANARGIPTADARYQVMLSAASAASSAR